jgi:hypothetical protein
MRENHFLPKLLAKENITIRHGNYKTAWFDIKNRVLGLPTWEDMDKDVYDLFTGHEVGHALFTPWEGWHDSPEKLEGCPRSYINVVEDARIEKEIRNVYPGLKGPFQRGYKKLLDLAFFGPVEDIDWAQTKLIDKINLKAKLGNLLEVPFSKEEYVFFDRSLKTETFEEVVQLVLDIVAFTKENTPELLDNPPEEDNFGEMENDDIQSGDSDPSDGGESEGESESEGGSEGESEPKSLDEYIEKALKEEFNSEKDLESDSSDAILPQHVENETSITDQIFRSMEKSLIKVDAHGFQAVSINQLKKSQISNIVISYDELRRKREQASICSGSYITKIIKSDYPKYIKGVKKNIQFAVREFEMKKAAYQYSRATVGKKGVIDVNRLHSYKTNEDIFSQVTNLADSKSHGMILLLDYSGSMYNSLPQVLDQVMNLIVFCKQINIPFDVYSFSTYNEPIDYKELQDGDLDLNDLSMPHLCSSSFNKKDYEDSMMHLFARSVYNDRSYEFCAREERLGSTPLDQALIVSHDLIRDFKAKHKVQKMNFITFTDGDSNPIRSVIDTSLQVERVPTPHYGSSFSVMIQNKMIRDIPKSQSTEMLLTSIRERYNTNTIGFFMADSVKDWNRKALDCMKSECKLTPESPYEYRNLEEYKTKILREYKANKCVSKSNILGYNQYYLVKSGRSLETVADEFETKENASKSQILTSFKKFSKSKKNNKVLMTNFAKAVAE